MFYIKCFVINSIHNLCNINTYVQWYASFNSIECKEVYQKKYNLYNVFLLTVITLDLLSTIYVLSKHDKV